MSGVGRIQDPEIRGLLGECLGTEAANAFDATTLAQVLAGKTLIPRGTPKSRELAKRELIKAHREELASILGAHAQIEMMKATEAPVSISPWLSSGSRHDLTREDSAIKAMEEQGYQDAGGWPTSMYLRLALSLHPRDIARHWLAVSFSFEGKQQEAIELLNEVLGGPVAYDQQIHSRSSVGACEFHQGRYFEAFQQYSVAVLDGREYPTVVANWANCTFIAGSVTDGRSVTGPLRDLDYTGSGLRDAASQVCEAMQKVAPAGLDRREYSRTMKACGSLAEELFSAWL